MLCAPYVYGVMYFLMKWCSNIKYRRGYVFGRASWHIYLTQMVFYALGGENFLMKTMAFEKLPLGRAFATIVAVIITFTIGTFFYYIETNFRKRIRVSL